jgi:hypothetical protein
LFKAATPSHPIAGPLLRILELGSDTFRQQIGVSAATINELVRTKTEAKRLIVLVDDVDRVDPQLVPQLLLALRELNVHLTAFVIAVDPASPIQPRLLQSLRDDLDRLTGACSQFGVELSLPAWWR